MTKTHITNTFYTPLSATLRTQPSVCRGFRLQIETIDTIGDYIRQQEAA